MTAGDVPPGRPPTSGAIIMRRPLHLHEFSGGTCIEIGTIVQILQNITVLSTLERLVNGVNCRTGPEFDPGRS
jgi:hypothetical protein